MKILIVDDELVSRTKLELILETLGECISVKSGEAALAAVKEALIAQAPFDLITLDIGLPGMNGTEVLYEIRLQEKESGLRPCPRAKIFMVTAQLDRDFLITCVQAGCDDYIIKPFDQTLVFQRLKKFESLAPDAPFFKNKVESHPLSSRKETDKVSIGQEVIGRFKKGEINLPSPSGLYVHFKKMVNEGAGLQEIAEILKQDLAISFHLISVSNSVYYRGREENKTLLQALNRLGLDHTRNYVDILSNRGFYIATQKEYAPFMEKLWDHSISCALAADIIVQSLKIPLNNDAFTLGLLHDVGKMVLIQIVSELETRGKLGADIDRAEVLQTLEEYNGKFGDAILNQWKFPKEFRKVAFYHNNLEEADSITKELIVVNLANLLSKSAGYGLEQPLEIDWSQVLSARMLKLETSLIEGIKNQMVKRMEETKKVLS